MTSTVSNLDTNKMLSGLNAGWEGTKKGIDSGFNKLGDWAVEYKANAGNAYSSANFVDLSKNAKDVIDIASSVTGIGAINKANKVKKAAEAAHKLSDDLVDLEKLNQSNNINKLDDARDLTKTVDDLAEVTTIKTTAIETVKLETGARQIVSPDSIRDWEKAEDFYSIIRQNSVDIFDISKNIEWSYSRVKRIKDHLFFDEHQLDTGVRRFDADLDIVNAWDRLSNGDHIKSDIDLMRHEIFESKFEGIYKTNYIDAHKAAIRAGRTWIPED